MEFTSNITQHLSTEMDQKKKQLLVALKELKESSTERISKVLVLAEDSSTVEDLSLYLNEFGLKAASFHNNQSSDENRINIYGFFYLGQNEILVSNLSLNSDRVQHVINYDDLPHSDSTHEHTNVIQFFL